MAMFTFLFLTGNTLLGANFVQKVKIVSLKSDSHLPNKNVLFALLKAI